MQVRDLQRDIENGDLRQQVRDLKRRLARLDEHQGKSNSVRSNAPMDDPLFSDVFTSSDADEPSKNSHSNIFSMLVYDTPDILSMPVYDKHVYDEDILLIPVYDKPVYDEDISSMLVYDKSVYDEDILLMPVYDKPVYDDDILLMNESSPSSVKFDDVAEDEGVAIDDDEEYDEAKGGNYLLDSCLGMFVTVIELGQQC
ncbi:hypothetical protein SASPL_135353 [Salvia splendens]|uniref:Uncharacterized protein n=1 Tax=Salvia splendens TaxID=180675 RepID=A0A8X8ZFL9_SALSN|nr:hypothetical protein SASPL_135353 [Salvia splendens]